MLVLFVMLCSEDLRLRAKGFLWTMCLSLGLSGKSFIPLLILLVVCLGVLSTRTIENEKDRRMISAMLTTMILRSAKWPITLWLWVFLLWLFLLVCSLTLGVAMIAISSCWNRLTYLSGLSLHHLLRSS